MDRGGYDANNYLIAATTIDGEGIAVYIDSCNFVSNIHEPESMCIDKEAIDMSSIIKSNMVKMKKCFGWRNFLTSANG